MEGELTSADLRKLQSLVDEQEQAVQAGEYLACCQRLYLHILLFCRHALGLPSSVPLGKALCSIKQTCLLVYIDFHHALVSCLELLCILC